MPRLFEVVVPGGALSAQEPISRLLCPVPEHDGPCAAPWGFSVGDGELVLGIYTTRAAAADIAARVRALTGVAVLRDGDPERFESVVAQYRIEAGLS
jgi:hypothetical protein